MELYGIDSDPGAVVVARRSLLLAAFPRSPATSDTIAAMQQLATRLGRQIRWANALADSLAGSLADSPSESLYDQPLQSFPNRFDIIVGNPPYHRELGGKEMLDALARSALGRRYRTARMDLWHYFLHRGLEWLAPGGVLSYIVPEYWVAGRSGRAVVDAIRRSCRVAEVFLLEDRPVFEGVAGRHLILTLVHQRSDCPASIRRAAPGDTATVAALLSGRGAIHSYTKSDAQLFVDGGLRLEEPHAMDNATADRVPLGELAAVRQGIVENPAAVTRAMRERHRGDWIVGEGVFVLRPEEVERLGLSREERAVLRPYHDLADLGRYYRAPQPSMRLVYSTEATWPDVDRFPRLRDHLAQFRAILDQRRETRQGRRPWWQLHWPRDERVWLAAKITAVQMAARPAFAVTTGPVWAPFSVNVLLPFADRPEDLHYLAAVLNSRLAWEWFRRHAKHRGVGLDINGHVLRRFPLPRPREEDAAWRRIRDELAALAAERAAIEVLRRAADATAARSDASARDGALDEQIDRLVDSLYDG